MCLSLTPGWSRSLHVRSGAKVNHELGYYRRRLGTL